MYTFSYNFTPKRNIQIRVMSTISLSCLVVGENPYEDAFTVEIDTTKLVSFFRDAIKEKIDDNVNIMIITTP